MSKQSKVFLIDGPQDSFNTFSEDNSSFSQKLLDLFSCFKARGHKVKDQTHSKLKEDQVKVIQPQKDKDMCPVEINTEGLKSSEDYKTKLLSEMEANKMNKEGSTNQQKITRSMNPNNEPDKKKSFFRNIGKKLTAMDNKVNVQVISERKQEQQQPIIRITEDRTEHKPAETKLTVKKPGISDDEIIDETEKINQKQMALLMNWSKPNNRLKGALMSGLPARPGSPFSLKSNTKPNFNQIIKKMASMKNVTKIKKSTGVQTEEVWYSAAVEASEELTSSLERSSDKVFFIYLVSDSRNSFYDKTCIGKISIPYKPNITLFDIRAAINKSELMRETLKRNRSYRFLSETYRFVPQSEVAVTAVDIYPTYGVFIKLYAAEQANISNSDFVITTDIV